MLQFYFLFTSSSLTSHPNAPVEALSYGEQGLAEPLEVCLYLRHGPLGQPRPAQRLAHRVPGQGSKKILPSCYTIKILSVSPK